MEPRWRWLWQHGLIRIIFILSLRLIPLTFFSPFEPPVVAGFGATGFVIPMVTPNDAGRRENQAGRLGVRRELFCPSAMNQRFENSRKCLGSIRMGTAVCCCVRQAKRSRGRRLSALGDAMPPAANIFDARPETEIPIEKFNIPHQPPERVPFDLDLAAFLANFAFETYRSPGRLAWEMRGDSGSEVRFSDGKFVSKVFPGMLTLSLLAVEGLPTVVETVGGDSGGNKKRKRGVNPCVAMVLSDKDMWSGTQTSAKRLLPGGRYWGELFSMHVHDPKSSVLKVWLLDRGDEGVIPLPLRDVFRGTGDHALVGSSRVLLSQVLRSMNQGVEDSWSGWVEMEPVDQTGGDVTDEPADVVNDSNGNGECVPMRIQLDLRFAPMDAYHIDVPTAPHASDEDLVGASKLGSGVAGWQEFSKIAEGVGSLASSEGGRSATSSVDDCSSGSGIDSVGSALKDDRGEDYSGIRQVDAAMGVGRTMVPKDDGMPDWDALTDILPKQRKNFELTCFIDNAETDTQVCVWRDAATKRLIVAFRGTEAWKDLLTDANFLLDELDREVRDATAPPADDILAVVKNTTASWKKERVKPLPETLGQQKENILQTINKVMDSSADLLRDLSTTYECKETPKAAVSTPDPTPGRGLRTKEILSAVQGTIEHGGVEPASALEYSEPGPLDGKVERSSSNSSTSSSRRGAGILGRLREVGQRVVGRDGGNEGAEGDLGDGKSTTLAPMPGGDGVLADTLAWVQQVAGAQMEAIATVAASSTRGGSNSSSEILAPFLRDQQDMLEATRDLVAKVNEFRDSFGVSEGLDGIEEQGKRVIYEKINDLRARLANATSTGVGEDTPKIHSGFKNAYMSVNRTLSAVVWGATDEKPEDWHVYVTGHSLGGALGTLAALDHARRYPGARLTMYNFGSPRVGNRAFAKLYDSFVGDSFRVVNNMDVVARMPRGTMGRILLDYRHAGRTVMVDDNPSEPAWIEGESEGGCPLDEDDPVTWVLAKGSKAPNFLDYEMKIMEALFSGKGIDHHLEPCYFAALGSFYTEDDDRRTA